MPTLNTLQKWSDALKIVSVLGSAFLSCLGLFFELKAGFHFTLAGLAFSALSLTTISSSVAFYFLDRHIAKLKDLQRDPNVLGEGTMFFPMTIQLLDRECEILNNLAGPTGPVTSKLLKEPGLADLASILEVSHGALAFGSYSHLGDTIDVKQHLMYNSEVLPARMYRYSLGNRPIRYDVTAKTVKFVFDETAFIVHSDNHYKAPSDLLNQGFVFQIDGDFSQRKVRTAYPFFKHASGLVLQLNMTQASRSSVCYQLRGYTFPSPMPVTDYSRSIVESKNPPESVPDGLPEGFSYTSKPTPLTS